MSKQTENVEGLRIQLHGLEVAIVVHYAGGRNILVFHPDFVSMSVLERPVFTLRQLMDTDYLDSPLMSRIKLPPILSNLLPEGALREHTAKMIKCQIDNEFALLAYLGRNLSGALYVEPIRAGKVPDWALQYRTSTEPQQIDVKHSDSKFSLAGVQIKFSSSYLDGRYYINQEVSEDMWIVKTPSTLHQGVPVNEYTCMRLAESAGAAIPEIRLIKLADLEDLPDIKLADEEYAYGIKRFDRSSEGRIHTEDFAQIFGLYPTDKYQKANYEILGSTLYYSSSEKYKDIQQMARRLLINILLGNGDAHLKNWSLIYRDKISPCLSPLYDVVFTSPYIENDKLALKFVGTKQWNEITLAHFEQWAQKVGVPWLVIKPHLLDVMQHARAYWPLMLKELPMFQKQKEQLIRHWAQLSDDFRIG
ncbi:type II toxin-antitoxin system HipA family toxin [Providencia vermicola]|uniref:type II toxin-antitoxin system HipA family toxin n=1 Tax=Providencia vermicola TaxID=333965 RepID=UPI001CED340E|nr:type II toxin-antitoxin system HipA family toxin [Providencia vermicola]